MTKIDISNNQFKGKLDAGNNMNINGFSDVEISITKSNIDGDAKLFNDLSINSGLKDDKKENEKDAVKKSTVKESTVEENTVKDECFIKLKAALTPKA